MIEKIIKYEVKVSVPSSQVSTHQKKFENVLHKAINTGQGIKQTNVVSITMVKRWKPWQDFLKEQQRNEQQQLLHYRKRIQEAEMQFVFTAEGIWETDWD